MNDFDGFEYRAEGYFEDVVNNRKKIDLIIEELNEIKAALNPEENSFNPVRNCWDMRMYFPSSLFRSPSQSS